MSRVKAQVSRMLVRTLDVVAVRRLVVLGDSHANVFAHYLLKLRLPLTRFDICSVRGATASGLENPNSQTQAGPIFASKLAGVAPGSKVIILLGEIDTGFLVWHRALRHRVDVEETYAQALGAYLAFLDRLSVTWRPIVISAPLPTIPDLTALGEVANLRKEVGVSQRERTRLAVRFNAAVEEHCRKRRRPFLNLDSCSLGEDGLVQAWLLNTNALDHHYSPKAYAALLATRLPAVLRD